MGDWKKIRIGDLFSLEKGVLQSSKCTPGEYTFITAAEEWKTHNQFSHDCESLVYAVAASGSLGRAHYVKGKFISSDLCFIMTEKDKAKYPINFRFYQFIFSVFRKDIVDKTKTGTSKEAINQKNFSNYILPYVDIQHQNLWEKKMTAGQIKITGLENEFSYQASYFSLLRQAILLEAIEGKLTADWRLKHPVTKGDTNTDAVALLEKIKDAKQKLIAEGKIKKEKALEPIKADEIPFELPKGWAWCRLGEVMNAQDPNPSHRMPKYTSKGIPFISTMNVKKTGEINFSIGKNVTDETFRLQVETFTITNQSFAFSRIGTIGTVFVLPLPQSYCLSHSLSVITPFMDGERSFFMRLLSSSSILEQAKQGVTHNTVPDLGMKTIRNFYVPLPPLSEQLAIVERVDKLLSMVDDLEKQVTERKQQAEQLMQAVLREAFEG